METQRETQEEREPYVSAIADGFGGLSFLPNAARSIQLHPRTGEAYDIMPGVAYYPLTQEQASHAAVLSAEELRDREVFEQDGRSIILGGVAVSAMKMSRKL